MSFIKDMGRVLYKMQVGNLIHRDLKPENVLIKFEDGKKIYKLCDFGYSVRQN
jgi:serine/threonine protein kinase